jgi:hypothetical protein
MSDPVLGFVLTRQNSHVQVIRKDDGGASLVDLRTLAALDFDAAELGELREMLDRAAMPGQVSAIPHIVTDRASHRRDGCPTCLAEPSYEAERRAEAHGQVTP